MDERILNQVFAKVMIYDATARQWHPAGTSSDLSSVRLIHCLTNNTFRIHGQKINDVREVVLDNQITRGIKYNRTNDTFIQWHDSQAFWGLNFIRGTQDAENFFNSVVSIIETLNQGPAQQPQPPQQQPHQQQPPQQQPPQQQQPPPQQLTHPKLANEPANHNQQQQMQQQGSAAVIQRSIQQQQQQMLQHMLNQQQQPQQPQAMLGQVPPMQIMQQQSQQIMQQQQLQHHYKQQQPPQTQSLTNQNSINHCQHPHQAHMQQQHQQQQPPQLQQTQVAQVVSAPIPPPPPPPPPPPATIAGALNNCRTNGTSNSSGSTNSEAQQSPITTNNSNLVEANGGSPSQMSMLASELSKCQLKKVNLYRSDSDTLKDSEFNNNNVGIPKTTRAASLANAENNLMNDLNKKLASRREQLEKRADNNSSNNHNSSPKINGTGNDKGHEDWLKEKLLDLIRKEISKEMARLKVEIIDAIKSELKQR